MTLFQFLSILVLGPIGLFCVLRMIWSIVFKAADFSLIDAFIMVTCAVVIVVSFVGLDF